MDKKRMINKTYIAIVTNILIFVIWSILLNTIASRIVFNLLTFLLLFICCFLLSRYAGTTLKDKFLLSLLSTLSAFLFMLFLMFIPAFLWYLGIVFIAICLESYKSKRGKK